MDQPPKKMNSEEIMHAVALLHPGETAVITFEDFAGITELTGLAELSEMKQIVIDNTFPHDQNHKGWMFWHNRQRRFAVCVGFSWDSFHAFLDSDKITYIEVQ